MKLHFVLSLSLAVGTAAAPNWAASQTPAYQAPEQIPCAWMGETNDVALVPDEGVARQIFRAVEERFHAGADLAKFPVIYVRDYGTYWAVFRGPPPESRMFGGGQLEMHIAKCNGAISDVHLSR